MRAPAVVETTHRVLVDASHAAQRLDSVLVALLTAQGVFATRAAVQRWIKAGRVRVEGSDQPLRNRTVLAVGTMVLVRPAPPLRSDASPDAGVPFEVVYEDEHLLVVDKPAGVVVHPARGHRSGTLVNGLLAREGFRADNVDPRDRDGHLRPGIVHRIDKDTSGLLVVAKQPAVREALKALFAAHDIERSYLAIVQGRARAARYDTPHGRHPKSRLRFTSRLPRSSAGVRRAVTRVEVVEALTEATLVRCTLGTGRTHQIRIHLLEQSNTPLVADRLYGRSCGSAAVAAAGAALGRQALHAAVLGFVHPVSGASVRFESALPDDMAQALTLLREWK